MHKITSALLRNSSKRLFLSLIILFYSLCIFAAECTARSIGPARIEFIIFGLILLGVALFHKQTFWSDGNLPIITNIRL